MLKIALNFRKITLTAVAGLLTLLMAAGQTACFPFLPERIPSPASLDSGFQETSDAAVEETLSAKLTPTPAYRQTTAEIPTTAAPRATQDLDAEIETIILKGLQRRSIAIKIDAAIEPHSIPEAGIEAFINRVFSIYQRIFLEHPEFFYLSGSINVNYSREGIQGYLSSMTVNPVYRESFASLSADRLNEKIQEVESEAAAIKNQIASQTAVPWKQLLLLHDYLVRQIVYENSQDQRYNNAYCALVERRTLCQGYAQAFQLIAQKLGFAVLMVMGEADGVGHAWNIVKLDGQYYHIDVTFDDPVPDGGSVKPVQHVHFLRSDAQMAETHSWERLEYPQCTTDGAHYYRKQGLTVDSLDRFAEKLNAFVNEINFSKNQTNRLELLFAGARVPGNRDVEEIVRSVLLNSAPGTSVRYSNQINLGVIIVDIIPE